MLELQGKWHFVKIEFKGLDAEEIDGEGPASSCMKMNTMEFEDDKVTTTIYFDQDCKEPESETLTFRLQENNLEFWSDYEQNWNSGKVKRFSGDRFVLENTEDGLITSITLIRI
ncbi:lipocalin family protein [Nonlabens sp.]|uniref:lipocalin family protein n=1 Tax=Nonlabens sp. TaxID=1888209 RepID=UPI003F69BF35